MDEIRLEIMFDDHLVKNRALQDYKKSLFAQVAILDIFQRGDPMNLVQNLFLFLFLFDDMIVVFCL